MYVRRIRAALYSAQIGKGAEYGRARRRRRVRGWWSRHEICGARVGVGRTAKSRCEWELELGLFVHVEWSFIALVMMSLQICCFPEKMYERGRRELESRDAKCAGKAVARAWAAPGQRSD